MLPTIVRAPLRSTYSSPGIQLLPFCCAPSLLPELRARLLPRAEPLDSSTATRVSPASTETIIRFFKWVSPHRRGVDRLEHLAVLIHKAGALFLEESRDWT